jgi:periplasmic divalent cation tolerance protein
MDSPVYVCFVTVDDPAAADKISRTLVSERLAACVNIVPNVTSHYSWKGALETASEQLLVVKTTEQRLEALKARLTEIHPYQVPELIGWPVAAGLPGYLGWVRESTAEDGGAS